MVLITISIIIAIQFVDLNKIRKNNSSSEKYVIVIHGGAGTIDKSLPDSIKDEYYHSLSDALKLGEDMLKKGKKSIDVVQKVVMFLEDDPKFNAGKGAVYTSEGTHELDASIMDGSDLSNGAVAGVKGIKNPIALARLVKDKTPHVLLMGEGAEKFGKKMGVEFRPQEYFDTPNRYEQWQSQIKDKKGTVGCVALDKTGNLAAATSTGGLTNKMPGRIGDSPLINAGTYANNKTCAVSATGQGEKFITNTVAYNISALMEYKNLSLKDAANEIINKRLKPGDGGIIAVDKNGNYVMEFNTTGMFRGEADSNGNFEVKIWK
ncbi:MAG: isoaspartyl peptidase/L-asparaginase [Ignavibacteriaceae bacterium]